MGSWGLEEHDDFDWLVVPNPIVSPPLPPPQNSRGGGLFPPPENRYHLNPRQYQSVASPESWVHVNPGFSETIHDINHSFSQLNLSTPSRQSPFMAGSSSVDMGLSPLSHAQAQYRELELQRLRIESAVRGQMESNMRHHGYSSNANSNAITDYQFGNIQNGGQSLVGAMNRSAAAPSHYDITDEFGLPGQIQLSQDLNYGYPISPSSNGNYNDICRTLINRLSYLYARTYRSNYSTLEELRGRMFLAAKDQHGCRFLQNKVKEGNAEEINMIFLEVKDHVCELMVNQFGNYLIQKLFQVCNEKQMTEFLLSVISSDHSLMVICLDTHGTRAMQKLLENLTTAEQKSLVMSVLRRIAVTLTKSVSGHHVIQHCLEIFSIEDNSQLLIELADNCLEIATDRSGCCVLQQCLRHAQGEPRRRLLAEIVANGLVLSENSYGNYVVQLITEMRIARVTADLLAQLVGNYVSLSMSKYGSNVVEKCLKHSGEEQSTQIIMELINSPNFLMLLKDPFGNYVAQTALGVSKGSIYNALVGLIEFHQSDLHTHLHGKRVIDCIRRRRKHRKM